MQSTETGLRTPLSRSNTGKLGTPGRLVSHKAAPKQELKVNVKQLIAPIVNSDKDRTLFVNECDKPDVHLRSDQLKPVELMRIQSAKRLKAAKTSQIDIDDESQQPVETFNFTEMISIGRPDRDLSLRVPLMRELQALRKYKMGTPPATKTGILRNTLEETVQDDAAKQLLAGMSSSGRPNSRGGATPTLTMRATLSAPQLAASSSPTNRSPSRSRNRTTDEREIVVRTAPNVNMNLYHLSSQGKHIVKSTSEKALTLARPPLMMHTDSIDSSVLTMTAEEEALGVAMGEGTGAVDAQPLTMYDPATVRLPRLESVPGFGNTNSTLDRALGAYRVHSNRAVTAAAALEEASVFESDSFHAERVESFYKSAETSHLDSLNGAAAAGEGEAGNNLDGGGSVDSHSVSSHAASSVRSIKTAPQQVPIKRGLHCTKCFRAAGLWCQTCAAAFCSVCWGQVAHHDLRQMSPDRSRHASPTGRPQTENGNVNANVNGNNGRSSSQSPSRSPVKHTYSKSVMFQSYHANRPVTSGPDAKYRQTAAAKIPLPDTVITQYDEYPAPPVFLDGRGRVLEDTIHRRPVTSPVLTQEELHRLQMNNHFKKQTQQEQYQHMLALKYKSNTVGSPNSPGNKKSLPGTTPTHPSHTHQGTGTGGGLTGSGRENYEKFQVTTGFHYEQAEVIPTPHSKGRVVVRKNRKKNPKLRPATGAFDVTGNGTLSLGYGGKPRSGTKQLTGISVDATKDISPLDWKTQLFAGNDVQPGSARKNAAKVKEGNKSPLFLVKPV